MKKKWTPKCIGKYHGQYLEYLQNSWKTDERIGHATCDRKKTFVKETKQQPNQPTQQSWLGNPPTQLSTYPKISLETLEIKKKKKKRFEWDSNQTRHHISISVFFSTFRISGI